VGNSGFGHLATNVAIRGAVEVGMARGIFVKTRLGEEEYRFLQLIMERTGMRKTSEALRFCVNMAKILYDGIAIPRPEVYARALELLGANPRRSGG